MLKFKKPVPKSATPQPDPRVQRQMSALVALAKTYGLNSFIFSFRNPDNNQFTIHFQNIPLNEAVNICGFGWLQSIRSELKAHPEYKEDYVRIFTEGIADFEALTQKINKRVAEYQARQ